MSGSTSSLAAGSRLARGSSSNSSSGSCRTARATATRCTMPRESVRSGSRQRFFRRTSSSSSSTRSAATPCRRAWKRRFSRALRSRYRSGSCASSPILPRTAHASSGSEEPSTRTLPACGRSSVASTRSSVLLPAPLGPNTTSDCPARSDSDTPPSASRSP